MTCFRVPAERVIGEAGPRAAWVCQEEEWGKCQFGCKQARPLLPLKSDDHSADGLKSPFAA